MNILLQLQLLPNLRYPHSSLRTVRLRFLLILIPPVLGVVERRLFGVLVLVLHHQYVLSFSVKVKVNVDVDRALFPMPTAQFHCPTDTSLSLYVGGTSTSSSLPSSVLARLAEAEGSPSNCMVVSRLSRWWCVSQTRLLVTQLHLTNIQPYFSIKTCHSDSSQVVQLRRIYSTRLGPMPLHIFDLPTGDVDPRWPRRLKNNSGCELQALSSLGPLSSEGRRPCYSDRLVTCCGRHCI